MIFQKTTSLSPREYTAVVFLSSVMVLPRSFVFIKLALLALFLVTHAKSLLKTNGTYIHFRIVSFYFLLSLMGIIWATIGYQNGGSYAGIVDNLRLYVFWSFAFILIFNFLLRNDIYLVFHKSIVISGVLISIINLFFLYDYVMQSGLVSNSIIKEMHGFIGLHDGYVQITSHNIGMLFFVASYLIALQFRNDVNYLNTKWAKLSLLLCLLLVILSGRRALWLSILLVPALIFVYTLLTNSFSKLKGRAWFIPALMFGCIFMLLFLFLIVNGSFDNNPTISHVLRAFSVNDERSIQKEFLIAGFYKYPIFGSGFGVSVDYLRNATAPWLYELTYHQLLFNLGVVGVFIMILIVMFYYYCSIRYISGGDTNSGIAFCLLIGVSVLSVGAYSNPYFGSFDFLLILGVLPVISASFRHEKSICKLKMYGSR